MSQGYPKILNDSDPCEESKDQKDSVVIRGMSNVIKMGLSVISEKQSEVYETSPPSQEISSKSHDHTPKSLMK